MSRFTCLNDVMKAVALLRDSERVEFLSMCLEVALIEAGVPEDNEQLALDGMYDLFVSGDFKRA